jgi:isoprenylcysteine carboxyl methyltransferase (ICMT) family protein YpbQ
MMAGTPHPDSSGIPLSVVPFSVGLAGTTSLMVVWLIVTALRPPVIVGAIALLFAAALPMALLDRTRKGSPRASREAEPIAWLIGFVAAAAPFVILQLAAIPADALALGWLTVLPLMLVRAGIDGARPFSGTPAMVGRAILARSWSGVDENEVRLWLLKSFFLPLYGMSVFGLTAWSLSPGVASNWLMIPLLFAYTIDLSIGLSGYVFASGGTSIQPRLLGWLVCLACYLPVMHHWPAFESVVRQEILWPLLDGSGAAFSIGAMIMVAALALYISATIAFGLRFANLANRGIITSGPYRLMKHPAYFAHVVNAWVLVFLLLPASGMEMSAQLYVVPIAFTILYRLRCVTEEQHLSADPDYRAYSDWISRFGLVATFRRGVMFGFAKTFRRPSRS